MQNRRISTEKMVMGAILTALVVVLQFVALAYRALFPLAPFTITLVLVPIVLGAALCDTRIAGWLGFVFGVIVLVTDAGAFLAISVPATVLVVLVKGTAAGVCAGLVYRLLEKKNRYFATAVAALVSPVVNTGIFLIGCRLFFWDTVVSGAQDSGKSVLAYLLVFFVGLNFVFELIVNIVLSPTILKIINIRQKIR